MNGMPIGFIYNGIQYFYMTNQMGDVIAITDSEGNIIVQYVSNRFKAETGAIVCRELLGLNTKGADKPIPEKRTQEYYKKRPCPKIVHLCADILEEYLKLNQL